MSDERETTEPTDADAVPTDAPPQDAPVDGDAGAAPAGAGAGATKASSRRTLRARLYHGETNVDFVGRRRLWFAISGIAVLLSVGGLLLRGFNLGIDFEGGVVWEVPAGEASVADASETVAEFGLSDATVQDLESDQGREIRVEAEPISPEESDEVTAALAELTGSDVDEVDLTSVGPSWGDEVSDKAVRALAVFLVVVTVYIALRFELKMAAATLAALVHDVVITAGVYALTQLEVTPATVIAILTILGYSIYDGIVVFDKVDENTRRVSSTGGLSYGGMVNLSLNQALMRSLNTTITALLPVGSLLVVGSWAMGASTLEEFAVALLIGLFCGAYSSIFIASPLLALLKEREPRYRDIARRVAARGGDRAVVGALVAGESARVAQSRSTVGTAKAGKAKAKAGATGTDAADEGLDDAAEPEDEAKVIVAPSGRVIPPRPRKKSGKGNRR